MLIATNHIVVVTQPQMLIHTMVTMLIDMPHKCAKIATNMLLDFVNVLFLLGDCSMNGNLCDNDILLRK